MSGESEQREIDPGEFRRVLGHLPTGVTVITARDADGPVGMTCNSFGSVSLEPPLVLFCVGRGSTTWPRLRDAGRLCVNVVAGHHGELSRTFSTRGIDRFDGVGWHERGHGPGLDDAVAWVECEVEEEREAGDHLIVIGRVRALEGRDEAEPLVFFRGAFGGFRPEGAEER